MTKDTTKQVGNPTGKGGFADNPQNRSNGSWKKTDTPRWKLERMMRLTESELKKIASDEQAPYFERKLAVAVNKSDWKVIKEMIDQVYGQPVSTHTLQNPDGTNIMSTFAEAIKKAEEIENSDGAN